METDLQHESPQSHNYAVSTLPIRNGNLPVLLLPGAVLNCKYLTYKEWKLLRLYGAVFRNNSKYLTYKEWKR